MPLWHHIWAWMHVWLLVTPVYRVDVCLHPCSARSVERHTWMVGIMQLCVMCCTRVANVATNGVCSLRYRAIRWLFCNLLWLVAMCGWSSCPCNSPQLSLVSWGAWWLSLPSLLVCPRVRLTLLMWRCTVWWDVHVVSMHGSL